MKCRRQKELKVRALRSRFQRDSISRFRFLADKRNICFLTLYKVFFLVSKQSTIYEREGLLFRRTRCRLSILLLPRAWPSIKLTRFLIFVLNKHLVCVCKKRSYRWPLWLNMSVRIKRWLVTFAKTVATDLKTSKTISTSPQLLENPFFKFYHKNRISSC